MQWLKLQKVASAKPDRDKFPAYYYFNGMQPPAVSMMVEQLLLFETIMVENRSILEFISADFAYLNRSLDRLVSGESERSSWVFTATRKL